MSSRLNTFLRLELVEPLSLFASYYFFTSLFGLDIVYFLASEGYVTSYLKSLEQMDTIDLLYYRYYCNPVCHWKIESARFTHSLPSDSQTRALVP